VSELFPVCYMPRRFEFVGAAGEMGFVVCRPLVDGLGLIRMLIPWLVVQLVLCSVRTALVSVSTLFLQTACMFQSYAS